jgi:hypothetical protein
MLLFITVSVLTLLFVVFFKYLNCVNEIRIFIEPSKFTLGCFIGDETLLVEFKEFTLLKRSNLTKKVDIKGIVLKKDWTKVSDLTEEVLPLYINEYIPKYLTSFGNTNGGVLYIGVSDVGEIIGIPIKSNKVKNVKKLIRDKINEILNLNEIKSKIKVDIIKCDFDEDYIYSDYQPMITKYNKELMEYHKNISKRRKIIEKMNLYKSAINNILNNKKIRQELIKFMCNNNGPTDLIEQLMENERIILDNAKISEEKTDIQTLSYWIVNYRTYIVDKLKKNIPETEKLVKPKNPYFIILNNIKLFSHHMIKSGYHFYVIKIKFPKINKNIFYMENNNYKFSKRIIGNNGPMTVDL